jgi:hypothetical protein
MIHCIVDLLSVSASCFQSLCVLQFLYASCSASLNLDVTMTVLGEPVNHYEKVHTNQSSFLAYFPKMKVGLSNYQFVCLCVPQ